MAKRLLSRVLRCDVFRLGIVIQPTPAGTTFARAGRSRVAPNPAVVVQLEELIARGRYRLGSGIVVQHLPTGARIAGAGFAGVTPDAPIVVQLKQLVAAGRNGFGSGIVVQHLPTGAGVTV